MPYYYYIDPTSSEGKRTIERLLSLRKHLEVDENDKIPIRSLQDNLIVATWNIREFDSAAYGPRLQEAIYYIAEIISHFDIIAIQEVRKDLKALNRLCKILGWHWKYIVTDVNEGRPGNKERMAFIYDSRKVRFGGLAGELVLPPIKTADGKYKPVSQIVRTPFICGFSAGWTNFMLTTVHIIYGKGTANYSPRIEEIRQVCQFLKDRTNDETAWSQNLILLGDFNIFHPEDKTMEEIKNAGFVIPKKIQELPTNAAKNKFYDQIAVHTNNFRFDVTGKAGVFDYYKTVFRDDDEQTYSKNMGQKYRNSRNKSNYYKTHWRTHQMSDHLPMWVELKINYTKEYLEGRINKKLFFLGLEEE